MKLDALGNAPAASLIQIRESATLPVYASPYQGEAA
jgi:hypothetical protein